jgi:cell division protease FtsH
MVAIIEGRDPAAVEDAYASTRKAKPLPGEIEPPAKAIHIVSEEIKPPAAEEDTPVEPEEEPPEEEPSEPAEEREDKPE